jgi:hypothetical protein
MILAFAAGLVIGTVGGMTSWVAAAAYLEAQRFKTPMAEAIAGEELSVATVENSPAFSPEQTVPAGQLYHRRKNHARPIAPGGSVGRTRSATL